MSQQLQNLRDYRCPQCKSLIFKYRIHLDHIVIENKCYSDNMFSTLTIELGPLFKMWTQQQKKEIEKIEDIKTKKSKI